MAENTMSSFEERLEQLEQLTARLENGQLPIDEAIKAYSEGMRIALSCRKTLDEMSQKVEVARREAQRALGITDGKEEQA